MRRLRVAPDVELGGGGGVAGGQGAAHDAHLLDPARKGRIEAEGGGDVRQRTDGEQGEIRDRVGLLDDELGGQPVPQGHGRRGEGGTVEATFAVDVGAVADVAHQRVGHPFDDGDGGQLGELEGLAGVAGGLFEVDVAEDGGQAAHVERARGEEDGHDVVVAGVAVDDDGGFRLRAHGRASVRRRSYMSRNRALSTSRATLTFGSRSRWPRQSGTVWPWWCSLWWSTSV